MIMHLARESFFLCCEDHLRVQASSCFPASFVESLHWMNARRCPQNFLLLKRNGPAFMPTKEGTCGTSAIAIAMYSMSGTASHFHAAGDEYGIQV